MNQPHYALVFSDFFSFSFLAGNFVLYLSVEQLTECFYIKYDIVFCSIINVYITYINTSNK